MPANWEWVDDDGNWTPYHFADNKLIENAFQTGAPKFETKDLSFNAEYLSLYTYDFKKLTQLNNDSGRMRKLRRIESGDDDEEVGFVKALSLKVETKPSAAAGDSDAGAEDALPAKKTKLELPMFAAKVGATAAVDDDGGGDSKPTASASVASTAAAAAASSHVPSVDPAVIAAQTALGAQSQRKQKYDLGPVAKDAHGKACFDKMLWREKQLSGEWAVFYHSYSLAALLYEVQAAVAAVLFKFKSEYATLPRLLKKPYIEFPDAEPLLKAFPKMKGRDHDPRFRAVAISVTTSLLAIDMEAPPKSCWFAGYSCADVSFFGVLENLLVSCGVPDSKKTALAKAIVALSEKHSLDVSQFKGKPNKSGKTGHLLQIFVKRSLVNKYAYASLPFGVKDTKRPDLEAAMEGTGPIQGQARVVTNPSVFMRSQAVRMYVYSADSTFHANRPLFQKEMTELLDPIIGTKEARLKAAEGVYGGKLPAWFNPDLCATSGS